MLVFIALFACGSNEPDCSLGFVPNPDGNCYEDSSDDPVPPSWDNAIEFAYDQMPACSVDEGNGELDLDRRCASGACVGMSRAEFEDLLGEPDEMVTSSSSWTIMYWWYLGCHRRFNRCPPWRSRRVPLLQRAKADCSRGCGRRTIEAATRRRVGVDRCDAG